MTDGFDEANLVPQYYVVSRSITDAQTDHVIRVLSFTPIIAVIISDYRDGQLANSFGTKVLHTTPEKMQDLARRIGEPTIIISGEPNFYAHYADGRCEEISLNAQI